jgi:lysophospholipase L1-like esterase
MHWKHRGWTLIGMLLLVLPGALRVMTVPVSAQVSQIATTMVTDTVYLADGTAATGTVIVSWQAFTTAGGESVPGGSTSATIGTGGAMSVSLAPNAGAMPIGSYYTAVYHLSDGSVSREFWVVPVSQTPVEVSAIKTTVLPTSVAMQTVSKSYVDTAIAAAVSGHPLDSSTPYVLKAGDTMTGALALPGDPATPTQAADKHYVDTNVTALTTGLAQKVSTVPAATQTVTQPAGTQMQVNNLNGVEYASQYLSGLGDNGIANATSSPDCTTGCDVKADRSYGSGEATHQASWNSGVNGGTHVEDDRNGERRDLYLNPVSSGEVNQDAGQVIDTISTRDTATEFATVGGQEPGSYGLIVRHEAMTGGSNQYPSAIEAPPYFKTNYDAMTVTGTYNTMGQHALDAQAINCYGVGDCLIGSQFIVASGGTRDEADEGAHPFDIQLHEDTAVFKGTCSSGCTQGSTMLMVTPTSAAGTQGEGRYLIDTNPSKVITSGMLIGGTGAIGAPAAAASFSGTNFPVSVFLALGQAAKSQAKNLAPGTVTLPIETTGVPSGFLTNTAAIAPSSGLACIAEANSADPNEFEMANYTVVDGTHLQLTLNRVHGAGATVAIGGLCGYGLEETVDTQNGIRQVFPVIGAYSPTGLYYAGGKTAIVGVSQQTGGYLNVNLPIAAIVRNNNVVTVTTAGNMPEDLNGLTLTVAGVSDSSYNGSFAVTTTGPSTLTYASSGPNSTSVGGTVGVVTGGYALYPMAEVLGVFDTATKSIDGQLTLGANTVAWAPNDPVEQPHYYQEQLAADTTYVGQVTPRPTTRQASGIQYQQNVGPGVVGWSIENAAPASSYFGNGGTHAEPHFAYEATGVWQDTMSVQAGDQGVFAVHCNSHGCGNWNSQYDLFELNSNVSLDTVTYQPLTSALTMHLRGASYGFTPQGFTANTINAGTINATTINGPVNAAQLTVFGASGASHAAGVVPDPGATAGATRYLREDGTWAVPAGGVAGGQSTGTSSTGPLATGASAEYNFMQGTGTTLTDVSGNGNDGTFAASGPAWTSYGVNFAPLNESTGAITPEYINLPASVNGWQTAVWNSCQFAGEQTTGTGSSTIAQWTNFPAVLGGAGNGDSLVLSNNAFMEAQEGGFHPTIFDEGSGSFNTYTADGYGGCHTYAVVCGSPNKVFVDGVEQAYGAQSSVACHVANNWVIGGAPGAGQPGGNAYAGTMEYLALFPAVLTSDQISGLSHTVTAAVAGRNGLPVYPTIRRLRQDQLITVGDSLTAGYNSGGTTYQQYLTTNHAYNVTNFGVGGMTAQTMRWLEDERHVQQISDGSRNVFVIWAGTNDVCDLNHSADQTGQDVMAMGKYLKMKYGATTIIGTMISRAVGTGTSNCDAQKNLLNPVLRQGAFASGAFDAIADFGATTQLGPDGANASATYFAGDHIHLLPAGQQVIASVVSNVVNWLDGYTAENPHSITSTAYTTTPADGSIVWEPTAAATGTLFDCNGMTGYKTMITNGSSFAITLSSQPGEPILGAGTVAANTSLRLMVQVKSGASTGCQWVAY